MKTNRPRDPFAPVEAIVTMGLSLFLGGLVLFLGLAIFQVVDTGTTEVSIASIGSEAACVQVPNEIVPSTTDLPQRGVNPDVGRVNAEQLNLCISEPTLSQTVGAALEPVGDLVFIIGGLLLARRAIGEGRRRGLFTETFAARTRQLGWFMLLMTLVWPFAAAAGAGIVVEAAVQGGRWSDMLVHPQGSVGLVIVSFGILTVARILRRAVELQVDVDHTI